MDDRPPPPDKYVKNPNSMERAKEEIGAVLHTEKSSHHHKETHGMRDDIDEKTPLNEVKAPNVFERAKEETEALVQTIHSKKEPELHVTTSNNEMLPTEKSPRHFKETHGMREDIDENTPMNDVKAPDVFERAKEEIEALVQTIHSKKESEIHVPTSTREENDVKAPNLIERAKEEIEAIMHTKKSPPHHHKETHGMSDDIDENTPIDEVKGPSVFQRAKEELEALAQTIHPKKEPSNLVSSPKEGGFRFSIRKGLEKVWSPWVSKKN
ncbi:hypothetical protein PVL29_014046 [Vitis rotundifolia]|uniref:Uncharacterized protein n=1 Tax=Vitis rotundifolia TaxID=103349 RepID=A0AA39DLN5_VITRO|nr:hypothetical protein PVL29_014046 [Vitis rotundifolia]